MTETFITHSQDETEAVGARLAESLVPGDTVAFFGGLGAGKTAFTRGALHALGFSGAVSSPTFSIVNEYGGAALRAAHFDMYRIENEEQLYGTGFYDYLDGRRILFIEWSENIKWALPCDAIAVTLERSGENERIITIEREVEL